MACEVPKCRRDTELIYYTRDVCWFHWLMHCREDGTFNLKVVFKIKPRPAPRALASNASSYLERRRRAD